MLIGVEVTSRHVRVCLFDGENVSKRTNHETTETHKLGYNFMQKLVICFTYPEVSHLIPLVD